MPFVAEIDCESDADAICVGALSDVGLVAFGVFDTPADALAYARANDLTGSIFTSEDLGFDYYLAPSSLTDGSSVRLAVVDHVIVISLAEDPGCTSSRYVEPDVNAVGLLFGGIEWVVRLG